MPYITDILLVLVIIICCIAGARKGLFKSVFDLLKVGIAIFSASFFKSTFAEKIKDTSLLDFVKNTDIRIISVQEQINILSEVIAFVILFVVALILLGIAGRIADKLFHLPVIEKFNAVGGMIFGALCGYFYVSVITVILWLVLRYGPELGISIDPELGDKTIVFRLLCEYNLFRVLLGF